MIVGDNDGLMARSQWFHELLTRLNIQYRFVISKGAIHDLREEMSRAATSRLSAGLDALESASAGRNACPTLACQSGTVISMTMIISRQ